jgi:hypothetical protein
VIKAKERKQIEVRRIKNEKESIKKLKMQCRGAE